MKFQKGNNMSPNGRGHSPNKLTSQVRHLIANIVQDNMEQFQHDLAMLEPKERCDILVKLLKYVTPTYTSIEFDTSQQSTTALQHLHIISAWKSEPTEPTEPHRD